MSKFEHLTIDKLYFGTGIKNRESGVSELEFNEFFETHVIPRFPNGFTLYEARGQWQGSDSVIVKEKTYILEILHSGSDEDNAKVDAIREIYKEVFNQDSVLYTSGQIWASL